MLHQLAHAGDRHRRRCGLQAEPFVDDQCIALEIHIELSKRRVGSRCVIVDHGCERGDAIGHVGGAIEMILHQRMYIVIGQFCEVAQRVIS